MEQLYFRTQFRHPIPALLLFIGFRQSTDNATADRTSTEPVDETAAPSQQLSDEELLILIQQQTFQYFRERAEPTFGAVRERNRQDGVYPQNYQDVATTSATGFGVIAMVGIERSFITREEGFERTLLGSGL